MLPDLPTLHQRRWLGASLEFQLQDERTLLCRRRSAFDLDESRIDLAELGPQPLRKRRFPATGWFAGVLLAVLTLGIPILVTCTEEPTSPDLIAVWLTCALLFGVPGSFCLLRAWQGTYDLTVFAGPDSQVCLRTHRPDPRAFATFVAELQRRIEKQLHARVLHPDADMWTELERIGAMFESGLLDDAEFRAAKRHVLGSRDPGEAIGFGAGAQAAPTAAPDDSEAPPQPRNAIAQNDTACDPSDARAAP